MTLGLDRKTMLGYDDRCSTYSVDRYMQHIGISVRNMLKARYLHSFWSLMSREVGDH